MTVGDIEHVVGRPTIIETVRPNTGHAALGHLFNFVIREQLPFVNRDGIEPGVVGAGAG